MSLRNRLILVLMVGLILRVGLLFVFWDEPLTIVDEKHYQMIAENLLNHQEFSHRFGKPTAFRPPLYPFFLSGIYFITGGIHFNAVRIAQIILSLGMIWIVFRLGAMIFNEQCGFWAALISAVYPSFVFFTHFLLTEVLFTFLLLLFVYFFISFLSYQARESEIETGGDDLNKKDKAALFDPGPSIAKREKRDILLAGLFLGLGALTRSILYPFLGLVTIFIIFVCRGNLLKRIKWALFLAIGFILVVSPWAIRNYFLFKDLVIIDTMGGLNMYLGNYEHTPLNRAWAGIDLTGDKTWFYGHEKELAIMNEAQKQKWAMNRAKEFIIDHKWLTLKRDIIKAVNFWGLEREVIAPIMNGHWPRLNKMSYLIFIALLIFSTYGLVLALSVFGFLFHLQFCNKNILFCVVLILFFTGMHAIVFAHSRYHLPLIPLLAIYASWSLLNLKNIWESRYSWKAISSMMLVATLMGIWLREILFVEGALFLKNIHL